MHQPAFWTVTTVLIAINLLVYCGQHFAIRLGWNYEQYLALQPDLLLQGHAWQLVTFQFLHDTTGPLHIIFNLVFLWFFGRQVESFLGRISFLKLYLWSGVAGGLTQVIVSKGFGTEPIALLGASAGVCGIIAAFAAIHWEQKLVLWLAFVYPIPTRGKYVVMMLLAACIAEWQFGAENVAHAAHLGGIWMGLVYIRWIVQADRVLNAWEAIRSRIKARPLIERVEPPEVPFASVDPPTASPPPPPPPPSIRLQRPP
ncbi:MAG: rhomboid family intramembrane serine protease, partial [Limisphaerales bacterium]